MNDATDRVRFTDETAPADGEPASYWLPTRPYTIIDAALRRRGVAYDSPLYAHPAATIGFDGRCVQVAFYPHAGHWRAESFDFERATLERGPLTECLAAGRKRHDAGARGASVVAYVHRDAPEPVALQRVAMVAAGFIPHSLDIERAHVESFADWRFAIVAAHGDALACSHVLRCGHHYADEIAWAARYFGHPRRGEHLAEIRTEIVRCWRAQARAACCASRLTQTARPSFRFWPPIHGRQ